MLEIGKFTFLHLVLNNLPVNQAYVIKQDRKRFMLTDMYSLFLTIGK